jgi:hypothetical protein
MKSLMLSMYMMYKEYSQIGPLNSHGSNGFLCFVCRSICIRSDDNNTLVLYTLPFDCSYLFFRCLVTENKIFSDNYGSQRWRIKMVGNLAITDGFFS